MIKHTHLHQILQHQIFPICSDCIVKKNVISLSSEIPILIWTPHIKIDQGGPLLRVAVIAPDRTYRTHGAQGHYRHWHSRPQDHVHDRA
jgi:hypothetical protein